MQFFIAIIIGERKSIFAGHLYNEYANPPGFCFDFKCSDDPIVDNPKSSEYNAPEKVNSS